jgi:uncharacterized SAM-binding protein YcdF (DUF218 family)
VGLSFLARVQLVLLLAFLVLPEVALVGIFSAGALLAAPAMAAKPADVVVVLGGGGNGERYVRGRELVLAGYAPRLILMYPGSAEAGDARRRIVNLQILDSAPMPGSWGEAEAVRRHMLAEGLHSVIVVSDPPHMLRLRYTWGAQFRGTGLQFQLVATSPSWWPGWRWWRTPQAASFVGDEVLKLGGYVLRYRFGW